MLNGDKESPEVKLLRGFVLQREAELEIAQRLLTEARKREYDHITFALLDGAAERHPDLEFEVLAVHDWKAGRFEYAARYEKREGQPRLIGGYQSNDRFSGDGSCYIPKIYEEKLLA